MEPRFGHDFSTVRVHTNERAAQSARGVNALAYTSGNNIVFDAAQYNPSSAAGSRLLAHELAHVVQQGSANAAPALQREPTPDPPPPPAGDKDTPAKKDDDPTAWLTLQAQGLGQYQYLFTIPRPPPWMLGAQLAANFQFHAGKTGFELGILGQYGHIFKQSVDATGLKPGDPKFGQGQGEGNQGQIVIQPAWVFFNTGHTQLALIGGAGFAGTSSSDPGVAGKQFSLLAGPQITQDLPIPLGPLKAQVVGSLAGGGVWSKGPQDDKFAASGAVTVGVGIQFAWDAVGRKKLPPAPPEHVEVKLPDPEQQKKSEDTKKDPDAEKKKADDAKKDEEAKKKVDQDPDKPADKGPKPPPPPPADGKIFFLKDKPLIGLPDDKSVLDTGGEDLNALKTRVQTALALDPTLKIAILGSASIEAPTPKYNCDLGSRRVEWLRRRLGLTSDQIADPADKSIVADNCEDTGGLVSFGSTNATDTKVEETRRQDRNAIVRFHRL